MNGLVNSFSQFTIAPPNKLILGCKPHCLQKGKKKTSCEKGLLGGVLQKKKKIPKSFAIRYQPLVEVLQSSYDALQIVVLKKSQISQESICAGVFFNKVANPQKSNLIKKWLQHRFFPVKFTKFLGIPFLQNISSGCFWQFQVSSL